MLLTIEPRHRKRTQGPAKAQSPLEQHQRLAGLPTVVVTSPRLSRQSLSPAVSPEAFQS